MTRKERQKIKLNQNQIELSYEKNFYHTRIMDVLKKMNGDTIANKRKMYVVFIYFHFLSFCSFHYISKFFLQ